MVVGLKWRDTDLTERQIFQVFRFRHGLIAEIDDLVDRRKALGAVGAQE